MKVRSKKLWQYLADCNLLNASEVEIATAKVKYRRLYKTEWKQNRTKPEKEIRPVFSLREYMELKVKASEMGMKPTRYLKSLAISSLNSGSMAPNKEALNRVMQLITQAVTTNDTKPIADAEQLLLNYIKNH